MRLRFPVLLAAIALLGAGLAPAATAAQPAPDHTVAGGKRVVGYFTEWGVYDRNYHVKNIKTSGSAAKLTKTSYAGIPTAGFYSDAAIQKLKSKGVPASKLLLGIGFYGRGWTGVTQAAPGGSATGAAPGKYEAGIEDYKLISTRCPSTGTVGGTAYAFCNGQWWGYDTPATIRSKMTYANGQGLGGAFFWELSGDTTDGSLITAVKTVG